MPLTDKLYQWFDMNRKKIIENHHGKQVLIHDFKVIDYFDDFAAAIAYAREKNMADEEFIVQDCLLPEEEAAENRLGWFSVETA